MTAPKFGDHVTWTVTDEDSSETFTGHVVGHSLDGLTVHTDDGRIRDVKPALVTIVPKSAVEQHHLDAHSELHLDRETMNATNGHVTEQAVYAERAKRIQLARSAQVPGGRETYDLVTPAVALDKIIENTPEQPSPVPQVSRWTWPLGKASE